MSKMDGMPTFRIVSYRVCKRYVTDSDFNMYGTF